MKLRQLYLIPAFAVTATAVGIGVASTAAADCNYSGGTTLCASGGTVTGGSAPAPGSFNPYPCRNDPALCNYYETWDPNIYLDVGRPGGGIGNRPGRG